jgi:ubiquinone/menaquinone biosynthesis C-methylase UbiE
MPSDNLYRTASDSADVSETVAYFDREAARLAFDAGASREREELVSTFVLPQARKRTDGDLRGIDFGCGSGSLLVKLLRNGVDCAGIEISPRMCEQARRRLEAEGMNPSAVRAGSVERLGEFADGSVDIVFVMGVLQYLPDEVYAQLLAESRRVLRRNGLLVASYQNALFDMFTFNRYTLQFYDRALLRPLLGESPELQAVLKATAGLVTNPDKPEYRDTVARDNVYVRTANPLTIDRELEALGFHVEARHFYEFHPLPPLIRAQAPQVFVRLKEQLEIVASTDWRGHFMANAFLVWCTHANGA